MKSLYVLVPENAAQWQFGQENVIKDLLAKHQNSKLLSLKGTKNDALKDKDAFFRQLIGDFERLKAEFDFVLIEGDTSFGVLGDFEFAVRIAKELNVGRSTVIRANEFAKGLTAAEEVSPGILQEVLSGSVKATQDEVSALARASPDTRKELVEKIRHPPPKEKKVTGKPAVTPPQPDSRPIELSPEQKCADALNELTDAVEMYVFRWDRCFLIYKDIFNTDEMQVEARKLIDQMQKYVDEKLEELNERKRNL